MTKFYKLFWLTPMIVFSNDAYAWGLVTHVYFAQSLLWATPILDPRLRNAIKRFPELVMAGACLPDLALIHQKFHTTHQWQHAHALLAQAQTDEELAIAIGYASHLYVDVIAHNHFVPAHEAMWFEKGIITHITSEWAMDAHLSPLLNTSPGRLLFKHREIISHFISPQFKCAEKVTFKTIQHLAFWDGMLRLARLPHLIYATIRLLDKRVFKHFVYYIAKTQTAMSEIGIVLSGKKPAWHAELLHMSEHQLSAWRLECLSDLALLHSTPITYFSALEKS